MEKRVSWGGEESGKNEMFGSLIGFVLSSCFDRVRDCVVCKLLSFACVDGTSQNLQRAPTVEDHPSGESLFKADRSGPGGEIPMWL